MRSLGSARQEIDQMRQRLMRQDVQHIRFESDHAVIYTSEKNRIYKPSKTGALFGADQTFVQLVMGAYGSGKSTMCIQKIVDQACKMPRWNKNRRRSKWLIIRNTSGELQSTTLQTWLTWFGELGDIKKRQKPLLTYEHTFNDGFGLVELELVFIALDRDEDIRKLKSIEATGAYINELSEVPQAVLHHLIGRVNHRYPSQAFCSEPYWSGIICDTNPPDEDHWIYKDFELNPTENYKIFHQPTGLMLNPDGTLIKDNKGNCIANPLADNYENLSPDYYVKLSEKRSEGFIKVYCIGRYGIVESGKRVYPEYNDDIHSAQNVVAIQGIPIHLCWDFGLTPACIVFQITARGRVLVLKEYLAEDMGIRTFAQNIVLPSLPIDFPYNKIGASEADPAGMASDGIMEELSCIGELCSLGIETHAAHTNDPVARISSVRYFLNTMIDGQPAFQLNRDNCPVLRKGFVNGYHFKRLSISGDERFHDKPNKNRFSHPHDALQYGLMKFASDRITESKKDDKPPMDIFNPVVQWNTGMF
jgi:PBSX family phage terminase large subunit